jgi:creatinine amidohydrolase/Fe(II)-dependent formamide hydrolase-like protein
MHEDMHAGEIEVSILLHTYPELVKDGSESADWIADSRRYLSRARAYRGHAATPKTPDRHRILGPRAG